MSENDAAKASRSWAQSPGSVRALRADILKGRVSPVALVERYLKRIEAADGAVQAWRVVDRERALAVARDREVEVRREKVRGPLHGIPVAIKDIIDVEGLPTRANCKARDAIPPATGDAEIVAALKAQGAIVLGKVHTTEFAFFDPSPARNPHNLAHTPGGSSSGSAAAVAAGMAPIAVGTQTVASVNRPAAYCGIAAFKPSTKSISAYGCTPLGTSYDTPGFYGWAVDDAVAAWEAVAPDFLTHARKSPVGASLIVTIPEDAHTADASPDMRAAWDRTAEMIAAAGHAVERVASPIDFKRLFEIQRSTMLYEAGRALAHLLAHPAGQVGAKLTEAIRQGQAIPERQYLDERGEIDRLRAAFFKAFPKTDAFMWPAAPGTAPEGLAWTGDPKYISPWTALGGPIVTMPSGLAANGLPVGCLLIGRPGSDVRHAAVATKLAGVAERHA